MRRSTNWTSETDGLPPSSDLRVKQLNSDSRLLHQQFAHLYSTLGALRLHPKYVVNAERGLCRQSPTKREQAAENQLLRDQVEAL